LVYQDIGDGSGVLAWAAGAAVADVGHSGRGSGVLDEDLAFEVGDGDLVAGDDDEDLLEARRPSTMYWTLFRMKTPLLVSFLTTVPSGRSVGSGAGVGRGRLAGRRIRSRGARCLGLRGGLPGGQVLHRPGCVRPPILRDRWPERGLG
jgi:hypothetical protein